MKSLFYTILILGLAFVAYDYFLAPPGQKLVFKRMNVTPPAAPRAAPTKADEKPSKVAAPPPAAPVVAPKPVQQPSTPVPAAATPAFDADGFPLPKFEPMDVLTKGWTFIPASAFPRPVKLMKDTEFKLSVGASKLAAGGQAVALAMQDGMLTVAPTETSPARASRNR